MKRETEKERKEGYIQQLGWYLAEAGSWNGRDALHRPCFYLAPCV